MNGVEPRIKFYSLGSDRIDFSKLVSNGKIDLSKEITISDNFSQALKKVIKKDIDFLSSKIKSTISKITKRLALNGTILDIELESDIKNIDMLINEIENLISNLIVEKGNIKLGVFATNKKQKKEKIKKLDDSIEFLSKCQNDIISIKNEYNKLVEKNNNLVQIEVVNDSEELLEKEDPLERTINFYMNKEER